MALQSKKVKSKELQGKELQAVGSNGHHKFTLKVYENSTSVSENKSQISFAFELTHNGETGWDFSWWSGMSYTIKIANKTYTGPIREYDGYSTITLSSDTFDVEHNNDGSKTINISFSVTDTTGQSYNTGNASASGSMVLTAIPRASDVGCSSPYIGNVATITIDKKATSFTSTVSYTIGSGFKKITGTIATKTSASVLSFDTSSLVDKIYALIPNAKEINGTIKCITYNGDTQIGDTKTTTFNLYAKESVCKPTVTGTVIDTDSFVTSITGSNTKFVKYRSNPKVTINATANKSSTIKDYSINLNDGQISNLQEKTFYDIGSNKVTLSVTDSRGYSNSTDIELDMIDYIKLHINNITITRTEGTSNEAVLNCNGTYYNGSFSSEVANTLTASFKYRKSGETDWVDGGNITPTITGNTFKFNNLSLGNLFDYNSEYQIMVTIEDKMMTIGNLNADIITLPKGQEIVAIGEDGVYVYGNLWLNDEEVKGNATATKVGGIKIKLSGTTLYITNNGSDA